MKRILDEEGPSMNRILNEQAGLCISPIFASRDIPEMQNLYRGHIDNEHHVSPHRWIAKVIKSLVILGDLGDMVFGDILYMTSKI
jgi:hypothetical protein